MKVMGLTGTLASGHTSFIDIACEKLGNAAIRFSTSDALREEAKRRGLQVSDRSVLVALGKEMREKHGGGALGKMAAEFIKEKAAANPEIKYAFVDSIRHTEEVRALKDAFGNEFKFVFTDAPLEIRHRRAQSRRREGEAEMPLEAFIKSQEREYAAANAGMNVDECKKIADYVITNEGTFEEYKAKALALIAKIGMN